MAKSKSGAELPRRTREHVIAALGRNHVERFFLEKGHVVHRPDEDYGYDLVVITYDEEGFPESNDLRIQLKASDDPRFVEGGSAIACRVEKRHYNLWMEELMPVLLVAYDAREQRTYCVEVREYFAADPSRSPKAGARSITVRIPLANAFGGATVDHARGRKSAILARIREVGPHES